MNCACERIYVVIEPDAGGDAVLGWLKESKIRERARLITPSGYKDPSELYLSDRANFRKAWKAVMKDAVPWTERATAENKKGEKSGLGKM